VQSNAVSARHEKIFEQISVKFGGFYVTKMNLVQTVLLTRTPMGKNIGGNSFIDRYSKGQISADNIGGPIYRSVSYSPDTKDEVTCDDMHNAGKKRHN